MSLPASLIGGLTGRVAQPPSSTSRASIGNNLLCSGFIVHLLVDVNASGRRHYAVVDAVRPVGRLEPSVSVEAVGRTVLVDRDRTGRDRGVVHAQCIRSAGRRARGGHTGGDTGVIGSTGRRNCVCVAGR